MSYTDEIRVQIADEMKAFSEYSNLFRRLQEDPSGLYQREAGIIKEIADDEHTHYTTLKAMLELMERGEPYSMYEHRMESALGHVPPGQQRRFPQTYGRWEEIANDINAKYPDDPVTRASVNYQLLLVAQGYEEPAVTHAERVQEANEAKRWLARKAWELGIT